MQPAHGPNLERFPPKLLDFGDKEALQIICFRALFPVLIESERFDQNGKGSKAKTGHFQWRQLPFISLSAAWTLRQVSAVCRAPYFTQMRSWTWASSLAFTP